MSEFFVFFLEFLPVFEEAVSEPDGVDIVRKGGRAF